MTHLYHFTISLWSWTTENLDLLLFSYQKTLACYRNNHLPVREGDKVQPANQPLHWLHRFRIARHHNWILPILQKVYQKAQETWETGTNWETSRPGFWDPSSTSKDGSSSAKAQKIQIQFKKGKEKQEAKTWKGVEWSGRRDRAIWKLIHHNKKSKDINNHDCIYELN